MRNFKKTQPLTEINSLVAARITQIRDGHGLWQHLHDLGIHAGDDIEMVRKAPFGGPIQIRCNGQDIALGRELAERIFVEIEK